MSKEVNRTEHRVIWLNFPELYVHVEILVFPDGQKLVDFKQRLGEESIRFDLKALKKIIRTAEKAKGV